MAESAPNRPPRSVKEEAPTMLKYFHPHLTSMEEVRRTLLPHLDQNGSFLVRISTTREKTYTVSVVHERGIKHFKILKKNNQYYLQGKVFPTIDALVTFYGSREVPNLEGITGVYLLFPIINALGDRFTRTRGSMSSTTGSISSMGSSQDDDEEELTYRSIFMDRKGSLDRALPPNSQVVRGQMLPPRRRAESQRESSSLRMGLGGRSRTRSDNLDERPPAPLPNEAEYKDSSGGNGIYNGVYYSCVRQQEKNKLSDLLEALKMSTTAEETHCECGLDLELSQLPQGWSIHISREADSGYGRPFFMSPEQVTSWDLPKDIYLELNRHQQKFIKWICDNYKKGNPPPDENTQIQWNSSSSSGSLSNLIKSTGTAMTGAASSANRDSTGSTTGAAGQGGYTSRGLDGDASGATASAHHVL